MVCEIIFKKLKRRVKPEWDEESQEAFDKIKNYLFDPLVLVPPQLGIPLILYLTTTVTTMGAMLCQRIA